jgi:hypothetical protein
MYFSFPHACYIPRRSLFIKTGNKYAVVYDNNITAPTFYRYSDIQKELGTSRNIVCSILGLI